MGFENQGNSLGGEKLEMARHRLAMKLDELILAGQEDPGFVDILEGSIRYMAENTRETLLRAMELAEKNSGGLKK
jgi:hypothetical protein